MIEEHCFAFVGEDALHSRNIFARESISGIRNKQTSFTDGARNKTSLDHESEILVKRKETVCDGMTRRIIIITRMHQVLIVRCKRVPLPHSHSIQSL